MEIDRNKRKNDEQARHTVAEGRQRERQEGE